jgi:hypothetical protein
MRRLLVRLRAAAARRRCSLCLDAEAGDTVVNARTKVPLESQKTEQSLR